MPRIAMLIQKYYPHVGGAERQIQRLVPHLQTRGFEVCIITRHEPGLSRFEMVNGAPVYRLVCPGPKPLAAFFYIGSAFLLLSRLRPDLIHAHEVLSPASAALLAKRFYGWPVIVKVLRGGMRGDIDKLKRRPFWKQRFRALCQGVDSFVVISHEIDQELTALGVPSQKRAFIPNGVDTETFAPLTDSHKKNLRAELLLSADGPLVLYLGRLTSEKRVDHLISIWPTMRSAFPQAQLLIVGAGPEEPRLRTQSMSIPGVEFTGQVNDPLSYLQAADLFVLPSATEGLSNSLLEAMSTGLPVLATSVGGTPDVITHGENGYLIPPDDPPALETGLIDLLANPSLCAHMGAQGRRRIQTDFSLESVANRLAALYERLGARQTQHADHVPG
ncbi:MAG: glycosyltransferase family 4 protein [Anaerolineales bacterium]